MSLAFAESTSLLVARESSLGTEPTAGWATVQPDPAGIVDFYPKLETVQPEPLSVNRQKERTEVVGSTSSPKLTQNLTYDLLVALGEAWFLANAKHTGGTGTGYFAPTSRTTTEYVVAAGGALQSGTIVVGKGWLNAANNGVFVVGVASDATHVKVAGGVAETPAGAYLATLEVAGFQGASGDIGLDVNGNLTSTVADFTTMGLQAGMTIFVGDTLGSAFAFANAAYHGPAQIVSVAANLITLRYRNWTIAAADPGTGKTIRLFWGRWIRNVTSNSGDFNQISTHLELGINGWGAGGATEYVYGQGATSDQLEISAPLKALVKATTTFVGTNFSAPTTVRATGANAGTAAVLNVGCFTTAAKELYRKVSDQSNEADVLVDIDSFTLTFKNGLTPQTQHGEQGTKRIVVGIAEVSLDLKGYLTQDDGYKACINNSPLRFGACWRNGDGGVFVDVPSVTFDTASLDFPANGPVTISPKASGFRDHTLNYTCGMMIFPYLPVA